MYDLAQFDFIDENTFLCSLWLIGLLPTIILLVILYRIMRSFERIADSAEHLTHGSPTSDGSKHRIELTMAQFLEAHPEARSLDSAEQIRQYAAWRAQQKRVS